MGVATELSHNFRVWHQKCPKMHPKSPQFAMAGVTSDCRTMTFNAISSSHVPAKTSKYILKSKVLYYEGSTKFMSK